MKHKLFIFTATALLVVALTAKLISGDGKYIGRIGAIDNGKKEIIVNVEGGRAIKMGEQLYVRSGDTVVIMEATFPMQTTVKCRLIKASSGYFRQLGSGMFVYKYDSTAIENDSADTDDSGYTTGQVEKIGDFEMVYIKGGTFMMGSTQGEKGRRDAEKQHKVTVSSFWIAKYEVTQKQYKVIMRENPSYYKGDDLPVENVSWEDAMKFCKWFGEIYKVRARLPYESEWEYACRAGSTAMYYWGNDINGDYCWYYENSLQWTTTGSAVNKTHPVGQKKPNDWGLYDMSGNVWEMCMDFYSESYYSRSPVDNPKGPANGKDHVLRGGSCREFDSDMRSARRGWYSSKFTDGLVGFRIVILH